MTLFLLELMDWKYSLSPSPRKRGPTLREVSPLVCCVLDLDHLGAEVGDEHRGVGPRAKLLDGEEAHPFQRFHATGFRLIHCLAMMMRCISLVPSPMHMRGASR